MIPNVTKENCPGAGGKWLSKEEIASGPGIAGTGQVTPQQADEKKKEDAQKTEDFFGKCSLDSPAIIEGCIARIAYYLFLTLPASILYIVAYVFNLALALTLGTALYNNSFLAEGWRIVRDFSNIFFILVLLYISIKMILGLGGAGVKKMVASVIIAALLINFSMFMTKVVIDASNILALIFYNKIQVNNVKTDVSSLVSIVKIPFEPITDKTKTEVEEKDIAGAIVSGFNPTNFLNPLNIDAFQKSTTRGTHEGTGQYAGYAANVVSAPCLITAAGTYALGVTSPCVQLGKLIGGLIKKKKKNLPLPIALGIIFVGGTVFLMASWAFFIAALAFIGRLIELWILIIFSPFAFMSMSIPKLQGLKYLGWDAWLQRLLSTAFMAPIFMFFLLLITKLIQIDIVGQVLNEGTSQSVFRTLIILAIPAIISISLLYKAVGYAKEHAGDFGSAVIKYGQVAAAAIGGLTLAAASGGTSMALTATLGKAGSSIANSKFAKTGGALGRGVGNIGKFLGSSSFDIRKTGVVGSLAKTAGVNLERGKALGLGIKEGGFEQRKKDRDEKRRKRAEEIKKIGENDPLRQKLNNSEMDLQKMLNKVARDFEILDKDLEAQRQKKSDAVVGSTEEAAASREIERLNNIKKDIKEGKAFTYIDTAGGIHKVDATTVTDGNNKGKTIKEMERQIIPEEKNDITKEERRRATSYAEEIRSSGRIVRSFNWFRGDSKAQRDATAHAIIMDVKIPDNVAKT